MIAGLVVSVLGNRLVDGGVDGLVAAGTIPVAWIALSTSASSIIQFALPGYAMLLQRISPDLALITEDLVEAGAACCAVAAIAFLPDHSTIVLICYLCLLLLLFPISDIADEIYGAKLAEKSDEAALAFNASLYTWLAITGFLIAVPLGALIASLSISALLICNILLSLSGAALRAYARRTAPIKPLVGTDVDEWSLTGQKQPVRQFLHDLLLSGPASPLISCVLAIIGAMSGHLLLIWAASLIPGNRFTAMSIVLTVFGIAAAIGPLVSRFANRFGRTDRLLTISSLVSMANISWFIVVLILFTPNIYATFAFIVINVSVSRFRNVVLETHRQTFFRGTQYSRVTSWSYAFGAGGTLIGIMSAYGLGLQDDPKWSLIVALSLWSITLIAVRSRLRPSEPTQKSRTFHSNK